MRKSKDDGRNRTVGATLINRKVRIIGIILAVVTLIGVIAFSATACSANRSRQQVAVDVLDHPARYRSEKGGIYVMDSAHVLASSTQEWIRRQNKRMEKDLGAQIMVVTVDKLPAGTSIEDYSMKLAERFKPGSAEKDNGLVYVLAVSDHKDRLEVGYGLESTITDSNAAVIIHQGEKKYKNKEYDAGVRDVVSAAVAYARGDGEGYDDESDVSAPSRSSGISFDVIIDILVMIGIMLFAFRPHRRNSGWDGDSFGGWSSGDSSSGWSSGSDSSSSSSSSGGGDSFGGGSFGGGGASGSW
ncbi:hypothetical protein HMPREF0620_1388 [Parascardovia denticolens DSM 10105 = JCM 12538]|uniref:TPM domain-containing protein n=1 Tax=Parascardovia denticolens DSM 10105 = JCM 12538 TaxID=864564 RepID=E6K2Z9_PARDN|nr:TPM domain-containing protein [Parascardovia denticolens]EFG32310.1 hypothetical protein HMPREF9017_01211 [Parascardovia denticolens F0305]EFT82703.1 hypothetical protein HMPREF0620_1388 [Parascardovia denticolens DSM 10105 = JCM 12538]BAR04805.1 conserved hypothetical protein [Parascardovia denticolens DSM 10105 = JCM 12538]